MAQRPRYYPAFLDLNGRRAVVVGAGAIGTAKVQALLPCGAHPLVVVAPTASAAIREAADGDALRWEARAYEPGDVVGAFLVIAATNSRALNATVARDARAAGALSLAVDDPAHCDLIAPAVVTRGDLTVAISTNGRSPALARRTKELVADELPAWWGDLLDVAADVRESLGTARRQIAAEQWQTALRGEVEICVQRGDLARARELLAERLQAIVPV